VKTEKIEKNKGFLFSSEDQPTSEEVKRSRTARLMVMNKTKDRTKEEYL